MDDDIEDMVLAYDEIGSSGRSEEPQEEPEKIDDEILDEVVNQLRSDLEDAVDLFESDFEEDRAKSQKYYNGETNLPVADINRSKYVHTKTRDTIRLLKPDIMRILMGTVTPVEYLPTTPQNAPIAEAQTAYVSQLFHRLGGYMTIYSAIHTACLHKVGVVKAYRKTEKKPEYASYTGLDQQQLAMLQQNPDLTVIIDDEREEMMPSPEGITPQVVYDVDVISFTEKGKTCMQPIKIEDFVIDEWATSAEDFRLIGHIQNVTVSDAVSMGFDEEDLAGLTVDEEDDNNIDLIQQRRGYLPKSKDDASPADPSQRSFALAEIYYWADLDDIGVSQLYRFWLGGEARKYLGHDRVDDHPYALFMIDPEPFTVFGTSIFDITNQDQDVMTSLARAVIDNAHQSNNPRLAVHETLVNMEDVLNNEIGAPIRTRGAGQIQVIDVPFTGGQLLPLMQYLDEAVDNKVGITRASVGLDPGALQSTDKQAVQNTIAKQAGQVELAVRNLSETGMKRLFQLLLKISLENPDPVAVYKVHGAYVPAPLGSFDPEFDLEVAVGIGTGTVEQRIAALQHVDAKQQQLMQLLGPGNPVVSMRQMMNTLEDGVKMMGVHNVSRYFTPVTPQMEQQIGQQLQQAQQAAKQQPQPDPTQAIIAAEQIKAQTQMQIAQGKGQIDMQKSGQKHQHDMAKLVSEQSFQRQDAMRRDDLDRDQMVQDLMLRLAELEAQVGAQIETANIQANVQKEQAKARPNGGAN